MNQSKATFLEYYLKKKEQEAKKKVNLAKEEEEKKFPDWYPGKEEPTPIVVDTKKFQSPEEVAASYNKKGKKKGKNEEAVEEKETISELFENEVQEEIENGEETKPKYYDSDDVEEAIIYKYFSDHKKMKRPKWLPELNIDEVKEKNPELAEYFTISEEREKELKEILKAEVRDTDKVIFSIIKTYIQEPVLIWKSLKDEELGHYLSDMHSVPMFEIFARYEESTALLPDLLEWLKATTSHKIGAKVFHYGIYGMIKTDRGQDAIHELLEMKTRHVEPLTITRMLVSDYYSEIVSKLCKRRRIEDVRNLLAFLRFPQVYLNAKIYHEIVELYINENRLLQARDVLYNMSRDGELPPKKLFAKIIGIYATKGDYKEAKGVLREMDLCYIHVPQSLSDLVIKGLQENNEMELAEEAIQEATYRKNLKYLNIQLEETYNPNTVKIK